MKLSLFFIILCFSGFMQDSDKCTIVSLKGINNIVVGQSSFEDIKKEFGKKRKRAKWGSTELDIFGYFDYYVKYDQIGTFISLAGIRRSRHIINNIIIDSTCKCKTKNGLGIGSSYQDVIKEFGEPKYVAGLGKLKYPTAYDHRNAEVNYEGNDEGDEVRMIITLNGNDTTVSKIREIRWYAYHYQSNLKAK